MPEAETSHDTASRGKKGTSGRFLSTRQSHLTEWMDLPDCPPDKLRNTYRQFPIVNRLISRWDAVYRKWIRPSLQPHRTFHLLDVGSGGGDITHRIWYLAARDGYRLKVTGIDPDPRAWSFATEMHAGSATEKGGDDVSPGRDKTANGLQFRQATTTSLIELGESFDFVICNHVLHHLMDVDIPPFMEELEQLAGIRVICSDIERSLTGYTLFSLATWPFFPGSFIRADGLISIRRSFTLNELCRMAPDRWKVTRMFPYRLVAIFEGNLADGNDDLRKNANPERGESTDSTIKHTFHKTSLSS